MVFFQTISLPVFNQFIPLFYTPCGGAGTPAQPNANKKLVTDGLVKKLHPITIAYWFAGDGGKAVYSDRVGSSKAIALNTQGFDEASIDRLVNGLVCRYGWDVEKVPEKRASNQWWLKIKNYDDFILKIGPYIHPTIVSKLPTPRSAKSRFGNVTQKVFDDICSSFFKKTKGE